jgi:hypothetical protein
LQDNVKTGAPALPGDPANLLGKFALVGVGVFSGNTQFLRLDGGNGKSVRMCSISIDRVLT